MNSLLLLLLIHRLRLLTEAKLVTVHCELHLSPADHQHRTMVDANTTSPAHLQVQTCQLVNISNNKGNSTSFIIITKLQTDVNGHLLGCLIQEIQQWQHKDLCRESKKHRQNWKGTEIKELRRLGISWDGVQAES